MEHVYDLEVDCIGLKCPLPVLKAQKALKLLQPGQVVKVMTTDPVALVDVPHMAREQGHELIAHARNGDVVAFWLKRRAD